MAVVGIDQVRSTNYLQLLTKDGEPILKIIRILRIRSPWLRCLTRVVPFVNAESVLKEINKFPSFWLFDFFCKKLLKGYFNISLIVVVNANLLVTLCTLCCIRQHNRTLAYMTPVNDRHIKASKVALFYACLLLSSESWSKIKRQNMITTFRFVKIVWKLHICRQPVVGRVYIIQGRLK